jgi:hypothetical protein
MAAIAPVIVGTDPRADVTDRVLSLEVSLTTDEVSQITLRLADPDFAMLRANYFQMRQPVTYLGKVFEIAAMEVTQGLRHEVSLSLRPQSIQQLKRDKNVTVAKGGGLSYVTEKARSVGLGLFMEYSAPVSTADSSTAASGSTSNTGQASATNADESAWDVIKRLAGDYQYTVFESDNKLFFASEPFMLGKFGIIGYGENPGFLSVPVIWNAEPNTNRIVQNYDVINGPPERASITLGNTGRLVQYLQEVLTKRAGQTITDQFGTFGASTFTAVTNLQKFTGLGGTGIVDIMTWNVVDSLASGISQVGPGVGFYYITPLGVPTLRKSDDAKEAATCSFQCERDQGKLLRPGMTIRIDGVPFFEGHYLVTNVSWSEGMTEPVQIEARTLVEPKPSGDGKNEELNRFRAALSWTGGGYANEVIGTPIWSLSR